MEILGKKARDKVTGFEGIIIGKTIYLYGCNCYGLAPAADKGVIPDTNWFDEGRIEIIGDGVKPAEVKAVKDGGMGNRVPNRLVR